MPIPRHPPQNICLAGIVACPWPETQLLAVGRGASPLPRPARLPLRRLASQVRQSRAVLRCIRGASSVHPLRLTDSAPKHQILSITDARAISYIVGEGTYQFPKPNGVRTWFRLLLGKGILWVEGDFIPCQDLAHPDILFTGKEAHERQRRTIAPALR